MVIHIVLSMQKYQVYHFRCPVCGLLANTKNLYSKHEFRVFKMVGRGRGRGFDKIPIIPDDDFRNEFQSHVLAAVLELASAGLLNMSWFKRELDKPSLPLVIRENIGRSDFVIKKDLGMVNFDDR